MLQVINNQIVCREVVEDNLKVDVVIKLLTDYFSAEFVQFIENPSLGLKLSKLQNPNEKAKPWLCLPYELEDSLSPYEIWIENYLNCYIKYLNHPL